MTISFPIRFRPLLHGAAGAVLALLLGCVSMPQQSGSTVAGTQWTVIELDGESIGPGMAPTLSIAKDGAVSGSDGCNRFVGGLVFDDGGKVAASPSAGVSTKMACPGRRDAVSRRYNALRAAAASWTREGDTLVIATAGGSTIRLRRAD